MIVNTSKYTYAGPDAESSFQQLFWDVWIKEQVILTICKHGDNLLYKVKRVRRNIKNDVSVQIIVKTGEFTILNMNSTTTSLAAHT